MKKKFALALATIAGFALGGTSVKLLQAQAAPPAYLIAEIDPTDPEGYFNQAVPILSSTAMNAGGVYLARGGNTLSFDGTPPPARVVLYRFDNMDKIRALANSEAKREAMSIGTRFANFRVFAVEGVAP